MVVSLRLWVTRGPRQATHSWSTQRAWSRWGRALERVFRGPTDRPRRRLAAFPQGRPAPQGGPAGRGRSLLATDLTLKRPDQFCSVDQGIYGHLTLRNLAVRQRSAATGPRPGGPGGWSSRRVQATPRPWRAGKQRSESRSLPVGSVSPMPSASARDVSRDTPPVPLRQRNGPISALGPA